jgi:solute carrier family 66 (lysosomal lysine-arginine transporter), member 1
MLELMPSLRVVVFTPQFYENYTLQSGEGLSIPFVLAWFAGDLFNLIGSVAAGLLPTVIILAIYVRASFLFHSRCL